jgi:hypothetical protein
MNEITLDSHILVCNDNLLLGEFIQSIKNTILSNQHNLNIGFGLNYINENKRKKSIRQINDAKNGSLIHFCSEGMSNYYHYKSNDNKIYVIKESICNAELCDRLFCCLENV